MIGQIWEGTEGMSWGLACSKMCKKTVEEGGRKAHVGGSHQVLQVCAGRPCAPRLASPALRREQPFCALRLLATLLVAQTATC